MRSKPTRKKPNEFETRVAELRARVHPPPPEPFACGCCGADSGTRPRPGDRFGLCASCRESGDDRSAAWRAAAVAKLLGVEPAPAAYNYVSVARFDSLRLSQPNRPNAEPWDHVDFADVRKQLEEAQAVVEGQRGGVCRFCGINNVERWLQDDQGFCCEWCNFDRRLFGFPNAAILSDHVHRAIVAAKIVGTRGYWPGRDFGLRWFHETRGAQGSSERFAYVDVESMREAAGLDDPPVTAMAPTLETGGPCRRCGVTRAPDWRDEYAARRFDTTGNPTWELLGEVCGWCHDAGYASYDQDYVVAMLTGLQRRDGVAEALGFKFFSDTKRAKPSEQRWHYADVDALRKRARDAFPGADRWRDQRMRVAS